MKYSELEIGDFFTVERENNANIYVKKEYWVESACNPKMCFRKFKGDTRVKKV